MKVEEDSSRKHDRVLEIYQRLLSGEILVKEQLAAEGILPKKYVSSVPEFIYQMMDGDRRVTVKMTALKSGIKITVSRKQQPYQFSPDPILLTCPELGYCCLTDRVEYHAKGGISPLLKGEKGRTFTADSIRFEFDDRVLVFMLDGEPVEVIDVEQWELKVPKKAR